MKIEITKNQRSMIVDMNQAATMALDALKAAQIAAQFAQEKYEQAQMAVNTVLSCIALDGGLAADSQVGPSRIIEEEGKRFLVFAEPEKRLEPAQSLIANAGVDGASA